MAIIDWDQFNENFQYYDQEIIREVIGDFFAEADDRLVNLKKNIEDKDFVNLAFNAHSLKSVVGVFMAPRPHELAAQLEMMGKQQTAEGLNDVFSELEIVIAALISELHAYLKE
jgi:HPt (histidine-containing phosphotransfer) domain-containing protein